MKLTLDENKIWFTVKSLVCESRTENTKPNIPSSVFSTSHYLSNTTRRSMGYAPNSDDIFKIVNADIATILDINESTDTYRSRFTHNCYSDNNSNIRVPKPSTVIFCEDNEDKINYIIDRIFSDIKPRIVGMCKGYLLSFYFSNLGEELYINKRAEHVISNNKLNPSEYEAAVKRLDSYDVLPFIEDGVPQYRLGIRSSGANAASSYFSEMRANPMYLSDNTIALVIDPPAVIAGHHGAYTKLWVNDGLNGAMEADSLLSTLFLNCDMSFSLRQDGCLKCPNSAVHCLGKVMTSSGMDDSLGPDFTWVTVNKYAGVLESDILKAYHTSSIATSENVIEVLSKDTNLQFIPSYLTDIATMGYKYSSSAISPTVSLADISLDKKIILGNIVDRSEVTDKADNSRQRIKQMCSVCEAYTLCKSVGKKAHKEYRDNECKGAVKISDLTTNTEAAKIAVQAVKRNTRLHKAIFFFSGAGMSGKFNNSSSFISPSPIFSNNSARVGHITHKDLLPSTGFIVLDKEAVHKCVSEIDRNKYSGIRDILQLIPIAMYVDIVDKSEFDGWYARIYLHSHVEDDIITPVYVDLAVALAMCDLTRLDSIPKLLLLDQFKGKFYEDNSRKYFSAQEMLGMLRVPKIDTASLEMYFEASELVAATNFKSSQGFGTSSYIHKTASSSIRYKPGCKGIEFHKNSVSSRYAPIPYYSRPTSIIGFNLSYMYFDVPKSYAKNVDYRIPAVISRKSSNFNHRFRWSNNAMTYMSVMAEMGLLVTSQKVFGKLKFFSMASEGKTRIVYKRAKLDRIDIGDIRFGDYIDYKTLSSMVDTLIKSAGLMKLSEYLACNSSEYSPDSIYSKTDNSSGRLHPSIFQLGKLVSIYKSLFQRNTQISEGDIHYSLVTCFLEMNRVTKKWEPKNTREQEILDIINRDVDSSESYLESIKVKIETLCNMCLKTALEIMMLESFYDMNLTFIRSKEDPKHVEEKVVHRTVASIEERQKLAEGMKKYASVGSPSNPISDSISKLIDSKLELDRKRLGKSTKLYVYIPRDNLFTEINELGDMVRLNPIGYDVTAHRYCGSSGSTSLISTLTTHASYSTDRNSFSLSGMEVDRNLHYISNSAFTRSKDMLGRVIKYSRALTDSPFRMTPATAVNLYSTRKK